MNNTNSLSILFFGDGPWAHKALEQILAKGYTVCKVIVRNDYKDSKLIDIASAHGIESGWHDDVNSAEFLNSIRSYKIDLAVSMSFNQIIRENTLSEFPKGFINCHAGKLPHYRGRNIINWALINDEKEIGVTCHYIDKGIDTGDIILQKCFPISDDDDYATILEKAIDLCPKVLVESIKMIADNSVLPISQPSEGSYFIQRKEGDEFIDWSMNARQIFNLIRAITTPGPCAQSWVLIKGVYYKLMLKKAKLLTDYELYNCVSGAVIGVSDGEVRVKCEQEAISIREYEIIDGPRKRLRVGDRLGLNLNLIYTGRAKFNE